MPSGLDQLYESPSSQPNSVKGSSDTVVDVVAIHGLNESLHDAWTDPKTNVEWLRDLLPESISNIRVLTFGYTSIAAEYQGQQCADNIQRHAHTLVAALQADRSIRGFDNRPIIFLCHGIGGVIVKKALAYSESRRSPLVAHLQSIFVSTYGILFFGTPHTHVSVSNWIELQESKSKQLLRRFDPGSDPSLEALETITDGFTPMAKRFRVFFFWEERRTVFGHRMAYLVEQSSAAPILDNTERSGIDADHTNMVKFSGNASPGYRTILAALGRYCREAPNVISQRQKKAADELLRARANEASELLGIPVNVADEDQTPVRSMNRYFDPPQEVSTMYVERREMSQRLHDALLSPESTRGVRRQKRCVVYGMGGCGKTELCSKFAYDNQDRFHAVFTIRAKSAETARESFAQIARVRGLGDGQDAGKHYLSQLEEPWLLIIDNADDPSLKLQELFPHGDNGHILITTRNPDFRRHSPVSIELGQLMENEALEVLFRRADIQQPWNTNVIRSGKKIIQKLGYLALALVQAGTSILHKICGLEDYLKFHSRFSDNRRAKRGSSDNEEDYNMVDSAFDLSFDLIRGKDTQICKNAIEILNIVSFFHFEHIPIDIFTRATENRQAALKDVANGPFLTRLKFSIEKRLRPPRVLPSFLRTDSDEFDIYTLRQALHKLDSLSLIHWSGRDESFSLHPLVHSWARKLLERKGDMALWCRIALNTLVESIQLPPKDVGDTHVAYRQAILPHLDECLKGCDKWCPVKTDMFSGPYGNVRLSVAKIFHPTSVLILRDEIVTTGKCGYVYLERGRLELAVEYFTRTMEALIQLLGYEDHRTLTVMLGLAEVYWLTAKTVDAIKLQKKVVEARNKMAGPDDRDTLVAMDRLGRSLWHNGDYAAALRLQEDTVKRMQSTLGEEMEETLDALDNYAITLRVFREYDKSEDIHRQVLAVRERVFAHDKMKYAQSLSEVALTLIEAGKYGPAKDLMRRVYDIRREKLGKENMWTLFAQLYLARINNELGESLEAEKMLRSGLQAAKRTLGEEHFGIYMANGELARAYSRQGRFEEAEEISLRTIPKITEARGPDHPDNANAHFFLSVLYERWGKLDKAIEAARQSTVKAEARLTPTHPISIRYRGKLEELEKAYASQQKEQEAAIAPSPVETGLSLD